MTKKANLGHPSRESAEQRAEREALVAILKEKLALDVPTSIRNGVKTEQETVSMQIRILKTQAEMLKAAAFMEGRPATAILRDLLKAYFETKTDNPDPIERQRWINAVESRGILG